MRTYLYLATIVGLLACGSGGGDSGGGGGGGGGGAGSGPPSDSASAMTALTPLSATSVVVANGDSGNPPSNCAVTSSGVVCWGGGVTPADIGKNAYAVSGTSGAVQIALTPFDGCARFQDGTVSCWGRGDYGVTAQGTSDYATDTRTAKKVPGLTNATSLAAGGDHACALLASGAVVCWGHNEYGEVGDGSTTERDAPVAVQGVTNATAIASGDNHTCALIADGSVSCWGRSGSVGSGVGGDVAVTAPAKVQGLSGVTQIAAGGDSSCAILGGGAVYCWGDNRFGQLGDGTETTSMKPVAAQGITGATSVGVSSYMGCASTAGHVVCWGEEVAEEGLGTGIVTSGASTKSAPVTGWDGSEKISVGASSTGVVCALKTDGSVECIGDNTHGTLGDSFGWFPEPITMSGLDGVVDLAASQNRTCAIDGSGNARCWGGAGPDFAHPGVDLDGSPVDTTGLSGATAISTSSSHACAIVNGGAVMCWGSGRDGALGDGKGQDSTTPVSAMGVANAVAIAAGNKHTCALLADGSMSCWGFSGFGDVGGSATPKDVPSGKGSTRIATSDGSLNDQTCVVLDSKVQCWGGGSIWPFDRAPYADPGTDGATDLATFGGAACALSPAGVRCYGVDGVYMPQTAPLLPGATLLSLGESFACAVAGGTLSCWGGAYAAQLGPSTFSTSTTPVAGTNITSPKKIVSGAAHTCALTSDAKVQCFGQNSYGQMTPTYTRRELPGRVALAY